MFYNDRDYYGGGGSGYGWYIAIIVIAFIICLAMNSCSVNQDRADNNMVTIEEMTGNYVYDKDTRIVYIEQVTSGYRSLDHATYRPYISPSGNYYKYENGKVVEIEKEEVTTENAMQ